MYFYSFTLYTAGALIKKRRYWPKYIPGDEITSHCETMDVGETTSLHGSIDGYKYDIFCMKEEDYVMKIMATYGALEDHPDEKTANTSRTYIKEGKKVEKKFKYQIPFGNHFFSKLKVTRKNYLFPCNKKIKKEPSTQCILTAYDMA